MMNYLYNIELYYSPIENLSGDRIKIVGDEFRHLTKVMRHKVAEKIYVTDGLGKIYNGKI